MSAPANNPIPTTPPLTPRVWLGKRIAAWLKKDLLSVKRHQELVDAINPFLNFQVRKGEAWGFRISDGNAVFTYPSNLGSQTTGSGAAAMFLLQEVFGDYLRCHTWDGSTEGSDDVYIAKDPELRHSLTGEIINGIGVTYTYGSLTGNADGKRIAAATGVPSQEEMVIPIWKLHTLGFDVQDPSIIIAVQMTTGVEVDGVDCGWQEVSSRHWAQIS